MTKERALEIAKEHYTFSEYLNDKYGALNGIMDHHELEDMAEWEEGLEEVANEILAEQ